MHVRWRAALLCVSGLYEPRARRVAKLYKPPREERFARRHCWNLTYRSSNASGDVRRTAEPIRDSLGERRRCDNRR
ncbi:MAG: hypothetical protein ACXV2A_06930 [Halobacteriota archaeon]